MKILLIIAVVLLILVTFYFARKSMGFRKFLAGAFFVSGGIQLYLSFAKVSIPLLGTPYVQTPELGRVRGVIHLALFVLFLYLGFIRKKSSDPAR